MYVFPAFMTPGIAIGALFPLTVILLLLVVIVVWNVRKLNHIDRILQEIQEKLKND